MQEIEFKWKIASFHDYYHFLKALSQLKIKSIRLKESKIHDFYLDTPDHFFSQSRISCRIRHQDNLWELTFKARTPLKQGLAKRTEKNIALKKVRTLKTALSYAEKLLAPILLHPRMVLIFKIKNKRTMYKIYLPDHTQAVVCLDRVWIQKGSHKVPFREIEAEFLKGSLKVYYDFLNCMTQVSGLKPAKISKVATAIKTFKLGMPEKRLKFSIKKQIFEIS